MLRLLKSFVLALLLAVLGAGSADSQRRCTKGKSCGNTCIARDLVCRVGTGTAVAAPEVDSTVGPVRTAPAPAPAVPPPPGRTTACAIERVIDGDTVVCVGGRRVRLLLIDAPEMNQGEYGAHARRALERLLPRGTQARLELDVAPTDRYRRTLAYVWLPDGRMANEELARGGYVVVSVYPPNVQHVERIRAAVREAQVNRAGLWSGSAFECPPHEHRRGRCD